MKSGLWLHSLKGEWRAAAAGREPSSEGSTAATTSSTEARLAMPCHPYFSAAAGEGAAFRAGHLASSRHSPATQLQATWLLE